MRISIDKSKQMEYNVNNPIQMEVNAANLITDGYQVYEKQGGLS